MRSVQRCLLALNNINLLAHTYWLAHQYQRQDAPGIETYMYQYSQLIELSIWMFQENPQKFHIGWQDGGSLIWQPFFSILQAAYYTLGASIQAVRQISVLWWEIGSSSRQWNFHKPNALSLSHKTDANLKFKSAGVLVRCTSRGCQNFSCIFYF